MRSSEFRRASGYFAGGFILAGVGWLLLLIAGVTVSDDPWSQSSGADAWATLAIVIFVASFIAFGIGTVRLVKNLDISNYYNAIHLGRMEYPQTAQQPTTSSVAPTQASPAAAATSAEVSAPQSPPAPPAPPAP